MSENVEDLTINYEEDGVVTLKELDKSILTRGAWSTIVFRYQQWEKAKEEYGPDRYTIRRYRKMDGYYRPQSRFNISSRDQAQKLVDILSEWIKEE